MLAVQHYHGASSTWKGAFPLPQMDALHHTNLRIKQNVDRMLRAAGALDEGYHPKSDAYERKLLGLVLTCKSMAPLKGNALALAEPRLYPFIPSATPAGRYGKPWLVSAPGMPTKKFATLQEVASEMPFFRKQLLMMGTTVSMGIEKDQPNRYLHTAGKAALRNVCVFYPMLQITNRNSGKVAYRTALDGLVPSAHIAATH